MKHTHVLSALFILAAGHACARPPATPHKRLNPLPVPVASTTLASPLAEPEPPPPRAPVLGPIVTGEVRCGSLSCKVPEEVCCAWTDETHPDPVLECLPKARAAECNNRPMNRVGFVRDCDTSEDCAKGERCCSEPSHVLGEEEHCTNKACGISELCSGDSCPAGQHCTASGDMIGSCVKNGADMQCGLSVCKGDTPVCRWSPESETGTCEARNTDADSRFTFTCDEQKDCPAGETCWVAWQGHASLCCGDGCFDDSEPALFCKTASDCPKKLNKEWKWACIEWPDSTYPTALRLCEPR